MTDDESRKLDDIVEGVSRLADEIAKGGSHVDRIRAELIEKIGELSSAIKDLTVRVRGNGQPGLEQRIRELELLAESFRAAIASQNAIEKRLVALDQRMAAIESDRENVRFWVRRVGGGVAVALAVAVVFALVVLVAQMKGGG